jgi:hypothetical protein
MAVGLPAKTTYANGDVFSASDINDTNGTLNLLNPTAKGSIVSASAANTPARLATGTQNQVLQVDTTSATGLKWAAGAWQTWSPSIFNLTVGNGTTSARYTQIGNVVFFSFKFTFGTTSVMIASPNITLPVASVSPAYFIVNLSDAGTAGYTANAIIPIGSNMFFDLIDTSTARAQSTAFSATSPFTWGNGDSFTVSGSYEVA